MTHTPQKRLFAMAGLALVPLFSDHMVLQRGQANAIWGWDSPDSEVLVTVTGESGGTALSTRAGPDGRWSAQIPELPVGGPYEIRITGSREEVLEDVLVGDVWLASGQSNMEWPVRLALDPALEVATSANTQVRHIKVPRIASSEPQESFAGDWQVSSPDATAHFSAIGYFFARELQQRTGVPIGIINSSWGGTRVEAWGSSEALMPLLPASEFTVVESDPEKEAAEMEDFRRRQVEWEFANLPNDPGNNGVAAGWAKPTFDDAEWSVIDMPAMWPNRAFDANGILWFRREVTLPASWAGRDLQINLGPVDDFDITYFNGVEVGAMPKGTFAAWAISRVYTVPAAAVTGGTVTIAVRVHDQAGVGGFSGVAGDLFIAPAGTTKERLSLAGQWRWTVEHNFGHASANRASSPPRPPASASMQDRAASLYNGMIHPLVPYGIKGVIWYQGESNADAQASQYSERFSAVIGDWRSRFGQGDVPFLFVQLANFDSDASWPVIRDQQEKTLALPGTGMAVTIDIGDPNDIHPRNKQEVARRLALIALRDVYGHRDISASGPVFDHVEFGDGAAHVYFTNARKLGTRDFDPAVKAFELAGEDGVFHAAEAVIDDSRVTVRSAGVPNPRHVRYAWHPTPVVNLVNEVFLPAAPFRTDSL